MTNTTRKTRTKKASRAELANLLYEALNHPEMPPDLQQGIYHALNEFENTVDLNQLCYSRAALTHALELRAEEGETQ